MAQSYKNIKIIVIGNSRAGKTKYVNKYTKNVFNDIYEETIVSEFGFKQYKKGGKIYRIQFWDLPGKDKNAIVTKIFAKDTNGLVVISDATNIQTRENSLKWKNNVDEVAIFLDDKKFQVF